MKIIYNANELPKKKYISEDTSGMLESKYLLINLQDTNLREYLYLTELIC